MKKLSAEDVIRRMLENPPDEFEGPFHAGLHAGLHGSDERNTHFKWFQSAKSTLEWERGKREAKEQKYAR